MIKYIKIGFLFILKFKLKKIVFNLNCEQGGKINVYNRRRYPKKFDACFKRRRRKN